MLGELYDGEFETMEYNGRMDACMREKMTREEAIKILRYNSNVIHQTMKGETDPKEVEALDMEIKALEQEPKTGHWIPVSERLPEEFESVLVCYKSQGGMAQAVSERFGTHTGYRWSALAGIEPIAWMPLPKPYEVDPQESEESDADGD